VLLRPSAYSEAIAPSCQGPESCRGRLGLREELPRLRQLDGEQGKWWAWVVVTPCAKSPSSLRGNQGGLARRLHVPRLPHSGMREDRRDGREGPTRDAQLARRGAFHPMRERVKMVFRKLEVATKRACCGWAEGSERSQLPPH
jgi:hypothetical protein